MSLKTQTVDELFHGSKYSDVSLCQQRVQEVTAVDEPSPQEQ